MNSKAIFITIGVVLLVALLAAMLQYTSSSSLHTRALPDAGGDTCSGICQQSCTELPAGEQGQCVTECVGYCGEGL